MHEIKSFGFIPDIEKKVLNLNSLTTSCNATKKNMAFHDNLRFFKQLVNKSLFSPFYYSREEKEILERYFQ